MKPTPGSMREPELRFDFMTNSMAVRAQDNQIVKIVIRAVFYMMKFKDLWMCIIATIKTLFDQASPIHRASDSISFCRRSIFFGMSNPTFIRTKFAMVLLAVKNLIFFAAEMTYKWIANHFSGISSFCTLARTIPNISILHHIMSEWFTTNSADAIYGNMFEIGLVRAVTRTIFGFTNPFGFNIKLFPTSEAGDKTSSFFHRSIVQVQLGSVKEIVSA